MEIPFTTGEIPRKTQFLWFCLHKWTRIMEVNVEDEFGGNRTRYDCQCDYCGKIKRF